MNLEILRCMAVFAEVAKAKSFTRAATALDLPKSTVSRRIAQLEKGVGLQLLKRTTQKVELTEEGLAYSERCRLILAEAEVAYEEVSMSRRSARGHLRVASTADFGIRLVAGMPAFHKSHPLLSLDFDFTSRRVDPLSENCDVAIYLGTPQDSSLTSHKLGEVSKVLLASPHYLKVHGVPEAPADLNAHDLILGVRFDGSGVEREWTLVNKRQRVDIPVTGALSMNSISMIRRFAVAGLGIGSIPESFCRHELAAGELVPVLPSWSTPSIPIYALTATRLLPARTRVFLDFVQQQL